MLQGLKGKAREFAKRERAFLVSSGFFAASRMADIATTYYALETMGWGVEYEKNEAVRNLMVEHGTLPGLLINDAQLIPVALGAAYLANYITNYLVKNDRNSLFRQPIGKYAKPGNLTLLLCSALCAEVAVKNALLGLS